MSLLEFDHRSSLAGGGHNALTQSELNIHDSGGAPITG